MVIYKIDVSLEEVSYIKEKSGDYGTEIAWLHKDEINNYAISTAF